MGLYLPFRKRLIRSVKHGIERPRVDKSTRQGVKPRLTGGMLAKLQANIPFRGGGGKGSMDRFGVVVFSDVAGIGIVRGGEGRVSQYLLFADGGCDVFRKIEQLGRSRRQEAEQIDTWFRGPR